MQPNIHNENSKVGHKKSNRILLIIALVGLACFIILVVTIIPRLKLPPFATAPIQTAPGYYKVSEVYDGDTIAVTMDGRTEKVRMIGVDTPETHKPNSPVECGGVEASNYSKKILGEAEVRLEADPTNQNRDRYDRLLRYIYLRDGRLFNKLLISEGYGTPYTTFPFQKKQEFIAAGLQAKLENKGVWAGVCTVTDQNGRFKTNPL